MRLKLMKEDGRQQRVINMENTIRFPTHLSWNTFQQSSNHGPVFGWWNWKGPQAKTQSETLHAACQGMCTGFQDWCPSPEHCRHVLLRIFSFWCVLWHGWFVQMSRIQSHRLCSLLFRCFRPLILLYCCQIFHWKRMYSFKSPLPDFLNCIFLLLYFRFSSPTTDWFVIPCGVTNHQHSLCDDYQEELFRSISKRGELWEHTQSTNAQHRGWIWNWSRKTVSNNYQKRCDLSCRSVCQKVLAIIRNILLSVQDSLLKINRYLNLSSFNPLAVVLKISESSSWPEGQSSNVLHSMVVW